jgi:hypothetical protein
MFQDELIGWSYLVTRVAEQVNGICPGRGKRGNSYHSFVQLNRMHLLLPDISNIEQLIDCGEGFDSPADSPTLSDDGVLQKVLAVMAEIKHNQGKWRADLGVQ